jgi:hypothetical protein
MSGPIKRSGPAAGDAAVRAGIDVAKRRLDTTIDLADAKFQRAVARLYRYGPRVQVEFLAQLGAARMCRSEIENLIEEYLARLDPAVVQWVGADRIVPLPPPRLVACAR